MQLQGRALHPPASFELLHQLFSPVLYMVPIAGPLQEYIAFKLIINKIKRTVYQRKGAYINVKCVFLNYIYILSSP